MTTETQKIPTGYKQTEIGVIPADWDVKELGKICKYQNGTSLERYFNQHDGYNVISIGNYSTSGRYIDTGSYISFDLKNNVNKFILNEDDLTMILNDKTSTGEIIGRVLLIEKSNSYIFNQRTMRLTAGSDILPKYLYFLINSNTVHKKLARQAKPGTQIYFNTADVLDFKISFPKNKTEQSVIINTLSDADSLVKNLEKLIEKKKSIKQGAMQELLTGKKRLPGFYGKWEMKKLGDICSVTTGSKDVNEGNQDGIYPFFTCSKQLSYSNTYSFSGEAILIAGNGEVGHLQHYTGNFEAYQRTYVLQNFKVSTKFLWFTLLANFKNSLGIGTIGSTIPYIKRENITDFIYQSPQEETEQLAIATILSDMDAEIEKLESQLLKYQNIKQGMMQTLLTGKIRLLTK